MIIYVDIDETICTTNEGRNYASALPLNDRIARINKLFDEGHHIIYWTARGSTTGIDWTDITAEQFVLWKVKCHELRMGKPQYDLFIDDKNINSDTFFSDKPTEYIKSNEVIQTAHIEGLGRVLLD